MNMSKVEKQIWDFFKSKGLNDFGIAGLMGNLQAESGLKANNLQNTYEKKLGYTDESYTVAVDRNTYPNFVTDAAGYGLAQWTYWSRKQNLLQYAKLLGVSIGNLDMQLSFLYNELTTKYPTVWQSLQQATSVDEASNVVLLKYEKPANQSAAVQHQRATFGQAYYERYAQQDKEPTKYMTVNVHAGHNPDGKVGCGAVGFLKESTEARKLKDRVIVGLQAKGYIVYDCTVNDGTSASDVLKKIVDKCNEHTADLDVSIHFNAGAKDSTGNGKTTGTEVLVYGKTSKAVSYAQKVCDAICKIGFKNRGVKERNDLYFLKKTKAPALLIEVCFVDDKDDYIMYDVDEVADAIIDSI